MIRHLRLAFVLPLALVFALTGCDRKPKRASKPATQKKENVLTIDQRFEAARKLLIEGNFSDAATALHALNTEPNVKQPLWNWIATMEGLALLLDGREADARKVYGELAARGTFSEKEEDVLMARFFVDIGTALSAPAPIPADVAREYDKYTFEGIIFLLYALKNWNLEKPEEAVPLFRQFGDVMPDRKVAWAEGPEDLKRLQDIAQGAVDDFLEGRPAMQALTSATTVEDQAAALIKAKAAREKMKLTTKLSKELDAKIAELSPKVAAIMEEKAKMSAEEMASDSKLLPEAKAKRLELHGKYQFAEARQAMLDPRLNTEAAQDEQQLLAKKSSWLSNFKDTLIEDLNAKGYAGPLTPKKGGAPITGGVVKADQENLLINSPRGPMPVPWGEIAPESIFLMGQAFITDDLPPTILSFKKWHLGVFASFAGRPEALKVLKEAAELRPLYAEELPLFERQSETW